MSAQTSFNSIGIIGKRAEPRIEPTLRQLVKYLDERGVEVMFDEACTEHFPDTHHARYSRAELPKNVDLVIVVGGDGTLLAAGREAAPLGIPLLGINLGRLGFMVDVWPEEMADTLDKVLAGEYVRENRLMLDATLGNEMDTSVALNEAVVRNKDFARVLEFDTYLDGNFISHHRADGLIISTPTGSTAYALSGGGPVLHPSMNALTLVPICPHTLSDRPIVVDASHHVEVVIAEGQSNQALVTCDGQWNQTLAPGERVKIVQSQHHLQLIHPPGYDYFSILRNKLRWGRDQQLQSRG